MVNADNGTTIIDFGEIALRVFSMENFVINPLPEVVELQGFEPWSIQLTPNSNLQAYPTVTQWEEFDLIVRDPSRPTCKSI